MCLTGDVALFQKSTLDVRNFYRSYGFVPRSYPHVADDHIALELDFMARMANRALQAIEAGDADEARAALDASHRFLTDFMLPWVPTFCKTVHAAEHSFFYSDVADVLEAFLPIDQALLKELLDGAFA